MDTNKELENLTALDPEILMLRMNKESAYNYQYRRYSDWTENYELYRDKIQINRLTQRQSVNIPLMKQTIRTLLKDVDDMPVLYFENLDNDKQSELFKNEYWKWTVDYNKMDQQDIVDKKQVFLFGRSFDQWQIKDGRVKMSIVDPVDILVDRYTDPFDLDSARFLIHTHIFVPLASLEQNPDYDKQMIDELKMWYATKMGLVKAAENEKLLLEKQKKYADLGVLDAYSPILGETYVEISLHFVYREDEQVKDLAGNPVKEKDGQLAKYGKQIFLYVEADGMRILMKKPLEKVIGPTSDNFWHNHYPYNTWADDVERQDFWSDGIGDVVRTSNRILNVWFSQLVENRTLRSFGMNYYDATVEGFQPQTMQPMPFGWYGMPGKPQEVFQKVDIPDLTESLDEMNFVLQINEKASGSSATQEGTQTTRQVTLGEVQLALSEAKERIKGMSKFYTPAWKHRGLIFIKLLEAAPEKLDAVTIYKKGRNTSNMYAREITPDDWQSKLGYSVRVWSQDEKDDMDTDSLQKLNAVKMTMPGNPKVDEIYDRKLLEFANLTPEEISEVMEVQNKMREQQAMGGQMGNTMPGSGQQVPPLQLPQPGGSQPQATPTQQLPAVAGQ